MVALYSPLLAALAAAVWNALKPPITSDLPVLKKPSSEF
jgi:hypothetical protein